MLIARNVAIVTNKSLICELSKTRKFFFISAVTASLFKFVLAGILILLILAVIKTVL